LTLEVAVALNPYAPFLEGRPAFDVLKETAGRLTALVGGLSDEEWHHRPADGKWSIGEVVCHLADTEIVFAFRLRQAVAETAHVVQPMDQNRWAAAYASADFRAALQAFLALRAWNAAFVAALTPAQLHKTVTHPERGEMVVATIVETMAGHDRNHLAQVQATATGLARR
jgi:uncharacterized damage-inducible protein DinB